MKSRIFKAKGSVREFLVNFYRVLRRPDMIILPGSLAFYFVLAIIPSLSLLSLGASVLNLSVDFIYDFISHSFSSEIADLILGVNLNNIAGFDFIITIIIGLYVASNGADAIIMTSNTIYNVESKSWLKRRFKAIGMTFIIVLLLTFMLIVPVFGNTIIALIEEVNLNELMTTRILAIFELIQGPITWLIIFLLIKVLYSVAPDVKKPSRVINYGALFTTIMFILGTKIYSIYVTNYAEYTALYGGLANIVVLMIWIYFLSYIFTVGIALNSQKDEDNMLKNGKYLKK